MTATTTVPHEASAWMRGRMASRLAAARRAGEPRDNNTVVLLPLGAQGIPGEPSDRTCDRCDVYTPPGPPFVNVAVLAAPRVLLVGGLCQPCADAEGVAR
jgi:hypothetical protein